MSIFSFFKRQKNTPDETPIEVQESNSDDGTLLLKLSLKRPLRLDDFVPEEPCQAENGINNKITLAAKGRSQPYYLVTFNNRAGIINIKCDCPAGELTKLCRHKLALVRGDISALYMGEPYDEDQTNPFKIMKKWIADSKLTSLVLQHDKAQQSFIEKEKEFKQIKAIIEDAMRRGA